MEFKFVAICLFSAFVGLIVWFSISSHKNEKREMAERRQNSRQFNNPPKSTKDQFQNEVKGTLDSDAIRGRFSGSWWR